MKERSRLGEQTIVGLRLLKDAVKFHDPVNCRLEKIPANLAHSTYKARFYQEKEEKKKEFEETKRKKEEERGRRKTEEREVVEVQGFFGKERGGYFKGREESKRRFRSCR